MASPGNQHRANCIGTLLQCDTRSGCRYKSATLSV